MVYVKVILDTRRKREDSVYPIKLRLTHNRVQRYYMTGYKLSESDFKELVKDVPPKRLQGLKIQIDAIELKARNILSKLEVYVVKRKWTSCSNVLERVLFV
jgi:integrase/recombinase XerD